MQKATHNPPRRHEDTKKGWKWINNDCERRNMEYAPLSEKEEAIAKIVVEAAYRVHKKLGPGVLEKVYEVCFCHEIAQQGSQYKRQLPVPIVYDELQFEEGLRLDVLVDDLVICELKAVDEINPIWEAQLITHLKLTKRRLGFLINFNVPVIKKGIKRIIL
jgi:GxxExxY protein